LIKLFLKSLAEFEVATS